MITDFNTHWRPKDVDNLIAQISSNGDEREKKALDSLATRMIREFRDHRIPSYYAESSRLSEIADDKQYNALVEAFLNSIIDSSSKGHVLDRDLLSCFDYSLRRHGNRTSEYFLATPLNDLRRRLERAVQEADLHTQYYFTFVIGSVLDVAVDIKVNGIDREVIHQPLHTQLHGLKDHDDPRLAQAASYAYEALHGIQDNESPWDMFWRTSETVISATLKVASSVLNMDPSQIKGAAPDFLELLRIFQKMFNAIQSTRDGMEKLRGALLADFKRLPGQRLWYSTLRLTGLLLAAGTESFNLLKDVISNVPSACYEKWQFWCGLYSQLEQTWMQGDDKTKDRVVEFTRWTLAHQYLKNIRHKESRIQYWINMIADTFGIPDWKAPPPKIRRNFPLCFLKREGDEPTFLKPFQQIQASHVSNQLFEKSWADCKEAQRFYADSGIVKYYTTEDRLKILRLSGQKLELENCYINLSMIETSTVHGEKTDEGFEISLRKRLETAGSDQEKDIQLSQLYDERKLRSGRSGRPRRILIRGRAGVGKSTLCKKIVHDFVHGRLSSWGFQRVLWIPLRRLIQELDPEDFLCKEFFSALQSRERKLLSGILWDVIHEPTNTDTLFILDGFDEVAGKISANEKLVNLLNRQNVIITSRPYAVGAYNLSAFDLELETVGFRPDQMKAYLYQVEVEKAAEIGDFIESHWLMEGLLQIPIQLDALCYTWGESSLSESSKTMTALYQAIEMKLWKKDMSLLQRCDGHEAKNYRQRAQIEPIMRNEIDLVEKVAFNGLYNNIVDFSSHHRDTLYASLPGKSGETDNTLDRLSFLRTADSSLDREEKTHYFIHLTFEEFFAANYFVRCWVNEIPLHCISLSSTDCKEVGAIDFLQREKYNARYNIMWRFVAGLLDSVQHKPKLIEFIEALNSDPKDVFRQAHLRILLHCFSEISLFKNDVALKQAKNDLDQELSLFVQTYGSRRMIYPLAAEMEFPEHLLKEILGKGTDSQKELVLSTLKYRDRISPDLLNQVVSLGTSVSRDRIEEAVGRIVGIHFSVSPNRVVEALGIWNRDRHLGHDILLSLAYNNRRKIPEEILVSVVSSLQDDEKGAGYYAALALRDQPLLPEGIAAKLASLLEGESFPEKPFAIIALSKHLINHPDILRKALSLEHDEDPLIRKEITGALGYVSLRLETLDALARLLNDSNQFVRAEAAKSLGVQSSLPENILEALLSRIKDDNDEVREAAVKAWSKHCSSTDAKLDVLNSCINDESAIVRKEAAECLAQQSIVSEHFAQSLTLDLQNGPSYRKLAAAEVFAQLSSLSGETLKALSSLVDSKDVDWQVKLVAIEALGNQPNLPDYAFNSIESVIASRDDDAKRKVTKALRNQIALPKSILETLLLDIDAGFLSSGSEECLQNQRDLPPEILSKIVSYLNNQSSDGAIYLAERVLRERDEFYMMLPDLDKETWTLLFHIWLEKAERMT